MKGFTFTKFGGAGLAVIMAAAAGCESCHNLLDTSYPERYNHAARQEVEVGLAGQRNNGHILDQTVWNYQFEEGTDKLTAGGRNHLDYLARRRPCPDSVVYLQTAHDLRYDSAAPEKFHEARTKLDGKRSQAIQSYLTSLTTGRGVAFEVVVHDAADTGLPGAPAGRAVQGMYGNFRGDLPATAGAGASNTSGGAGGGTGGGTGGGSR